MLNYRHQGQNIKKAPSSFYFSENVVSSVNAKGKATARYTT